MGRPAGARPDRPPRADHRSQHRLSDCFDLEGVVQRGTAAESGSRRSASRWRARPAPPMTRSSLVHWLLARSRGRRLRGLRQSAPPRPRTPMAATPRADLPRLHEGGAGRQARHAVPRRGRHRGSRSIVRAATRPCRATRARSWKPSRRAPRRPTIGATMGGDGGNSPEAERAIRSGVTSGLY